MIPQRMTQMCSNALFDQIHLQTYSLALNCTI